RRSRVVLGQAAEPRAGSSPVLQMGAVASNESRPRGRRSRRPRLPFLRWVSLLRLRSHLRQARAARSARPSREPAGEGRRVLRPAWERAGVVWGWFSPISGPAPATLQGTTRREGLVPLRYLS